MKQDNNLNPKNSQLQLINSIRLDELQSFTVDQISGSRFLCGGFILLLSLSIVFFLAGIFSNYPNGWISVFTFLIHILIGAILFFFIIPIHELIHFFVYKSFGAKHVKIKILNDISFQTVAKDFPANKRVIITNAFAPFLMISATILMIWYTDINWSKEVTVTVLLLHTQACFGDFAIANYLSKLKGKVFIVDNSKTENMEIYRYIQE